VVPEAKLINKPGVLVPSAEAIKKAVSIPVVAVGRLNPELGEWILQKGKADLIGLARRLLADPELPNKVASGRLEDIAYCTACLWCFHTFAKGDPVRCRINATLGREHECVLTPAVKKKKVMVIGGGSAGMEAARVATLRGHKVALYEREHKLGGLLPLAAMIKGTEIEDIPALVSYLKTQVTKSGVEMNLGKEVTPKLIEEIKPDVVILATGGKLTVPEIPGVNKSHVASSANLHRRVKPFLRFLRPGFLRWLTRFWLPIGKRVVIIGGFIQGCETAEFLVKRGRKVTILESSNALGTGIPELNRVRLLNWLAKKGVTMLTEVKYQEITDKGLILITKEGEKQTIESDNILVAIPSEPNTELFRALEGIVPEIYMIGDCKQPGLIVDAVEDGFRIASAI
jgi:2,4-dienoyl-CoA reductase (NADPH2)